MEGLPVLFCAVLLLGSTEGKENYDELPTSRKVIVDMAIELANNVSGHPKHIDFFSLLRSDDKMVHVLLKPTSCDKKENVHRRDCKTNGSKPWMSCVACPNTMDCVPLGLRDKKAMCTSRTPKHFSGSTHSLALHGIPERDPEQLAGCLGCI